LEVERSEIRPLTDSIPPWLTKKIRQLADFLISKFEFRNPKIIIQIYKVVGWRLSETKKVDVRQKNKIKDEEGKPLALVLVILYPLWFNLVPLASFPAF